MTRFTLEDSLKEDFADGVLHVIGVVGAIAAASVLVTWATLALDTTRLMAALPYVFGLIATFAFSAAYNMTLHARTRAVLRRFDHAAIYVMIAGTYTPVALVGVGGGWGITLASASWGLALIGVAMKLVFFHKSQKLGFVLYILQGWLALIAIGPIVAALPVAAMVLLAIGGVVYTVGTYFYHKALPYARAIWHGHVLAAAATHYAAVLLVLNLP